MIQSLLPAILAHRASIIAAEKLDRLKVRAWYDKAPDHGPVASSVSVQASRSVDAAVVPITITEEIVFQDPRPREDEMLLERYIRAVALSPFWVSKNVTIHSQEPTQETPAATVPRVGQAAVIRWEGTASWRA